MAGEKSSEIQIDRQPYSQFNVVKTVRLTQRGNDARERLKKTFRGKYRMYEIDEIAYLALLKQAEAGKVK